MLKTNLRPAPALPPEGREGPYNTPAGLFNVTVLRRGGLWLASLLAAAYLVLGLAVPLFLTIQVSVDLDPFWGAYMEQLTSSSLLVIFARTLWLAVLVTVITVAVSYPVAYAMTLMGKRSRNTFIALLVFPYLTSYLVRTYAWIGILGVNGPFVEVLHWFGINTLNNTAGGVLVVLVHVFLPIVVLTCYVSMSRIDPSHLRAARTLGANHLESFWRVYAPQTKAGVISGGALVFISSAGIYATPALIGGPSEATVVTLVVQQITQGTFGLPTAFPASLAVILTAVVALVLTLVGRSVGLSEVLGLATGRRARFRKPSEGPMQRIPHRLLWAVVRRVPSGSGRRHILIGAMVLVAILLIDGPFVYLIGMSFQPLPLLAFPTGEWSTTWYAAVFSDPSWGEALLQSVQIALLATILAVVFGSFLALRTGKVRRISSKIIMAAALLPMIVPTVAYATGIYTVFTQLDLIGNWVAIGVVHGILVLPYVYVNMLNGLNSYDRRWDQAADSLGASPWRRLRKVTFPVLRPALITGAFLAALESFGEFTVTLFMGGLSFQNLPLKFWAEAGQNLSPELAVVGVLMTAVIFVLAVLAAAGLHATRHSTQTDRSPS